MMKKLFNRKTAKIYIVLICVTMVVGIASSCFFASYSSKFEEMTKKDSSGALSELGSTLISALSGDTEAASDSLAGLLSDAIESQSEASTEKKLTEEQQSMKNKKTVTLVLLIVSFCLAAVFSAGTITCYSYENYLKSDKYKAKLKRLKKYEKMKTN